MEYEYVLRVCRAHAMESYYYPLAVRAHAIKYKYNLRVFRAHVEKQNIIFIEYYAQML